jgi:hypothetical protein
MASLSSVIGWLSVQDVIGDGDTPGLWADAPGEAEDGYAELANLMGTAHEVLAPHGEALDPAPERYKTAQLLYMRHLYARSRSGNQDTTGADGFQVSTWPLVQEAYGLMRQRVKAPGRRVRGLA